MKRILSIAITALPLVAACEEQAGDDDTSTQGSLTLTDAGNYSYENAIDIASVEVALGQDATVDFSGLTVDLLGHDVDAATEVDGATLLYLPDLDHAAVEQKIAEDDLVQSDVQLFALWENPGGATSFLLSEFVVPVENPFNPAEYFVYEEGSWLIRLTTGLTESRMVLFVQPSAASANTTIVIGNDSATIDFDADLQSLTPIDLAAEPEDYLVDWSGVTLDPQGDAFDPNQIDEVMVARYEGMTLDDLEARFFDLELIAAELYYAVVDQATSVDLLTATTADGGESFSGFGAGTLWLLALRCSDCVNPAPPFLTVVQVGG